jgi:alkylation response protein AidB-like acyl-CoA dehydrogenase
MHFAFTEHQLLFRDSVRALLTRECSPSVVRAAWSEDVAGLIGPWASLAELGVLGGVLDERDGGLGLNDLDLVLVLEETGRAALPGPVVEHTAVALRLLESLGSDELKKQWLARAASGEALVALSLDAVPYVSHADAASLVILQRADALHAVPRADVRIAPQRSVDGSRRLCRVEFDAGPHTLLATGATALDAIALAFDRGTVGTAAQMIGLGQHMLDMTVEYVKTRQQFGQPIGSFQAIKHALANVMIALEMARPVVYRAAHSLTNVTAANERALHASMAKIYASDAALSAARAALQCHGAIGYSAEHDLHMWMKRAWSLSNAWGDTRFHRDRVGRLRIDAVETTA